MRNIPTAERTDAELDAESALFGVIDKQLVEGSPRQEKIRLMIRLKALRAELDAMVPAIRESALSPDDLEGFWSKLNR